MRQEFPAMNGPFATGDFVEDSTVTDYCVGRTIIYVSFAWSQQINAYRLMFELAKRHKLGFYDVSADDGQVWLLGILGYRVSHGQGRSDL
jgi:hypothetical protein